MGARDLLEHAFPPLSLPIVRVTPGGGAVPVSSAEQKTALLLGAECGAAAVQAALQQTAPGEAAVPAKARTAVSGLEARLSVDPSGFGISALERVALHAAVGITHEAVSEALRDLAAVLAASPSLAWKAERRGDIAKWLGTCRPADGGGSGIGELSRAVSVALRAAALCDNAGAATLGGERGPREVSRADLGGTSHAM
mmetsp:Transcript_3906/g.12606  ORF Transcript_3906/g.12606 Transcript_3906/m.12606 type:complete len:198 (+) Transcript_3906:267-860(+)